MASLDKSLDDIISSSKRGRKFIPKRTTKKGLTGGKASKNLIQKKKVVKPTIKQAQKILDVSSASKVVVYGLPRDISSDAVKDFFQSQVGNVQNVGLSYNEKGQFRGIATIIFSKERAATKAVEKFNGAPIDGGATKLKLELIIDPSKKPLSARIASNDSRVQTKKSLQARIGAPAKKQAAAAAAAPKKKPAAKKKPAKKPKKEKKTVEQLDQEMTDYFDNSGN